MLPELLRKLAAERQGSVVDLPLCVGFDDLLRVSERKVERIRFKDRVRGLGLFMQYENGWAKAVTDHGLKDKGWSARLEKLLNSGSTLQILTTAELN